LPMNSANKNTAHSANINGYRVLGTTDDVTTCECCGRKDLKGTVALQWTVDGAAMGLPVFYGCVCAARAVNRPAKEIKAAAKTADDEKAAHVARATRRLYAAQMAACETAVNARADAEGIAARLPWNAGYCEKLWALAKVLGCDGFEVLARIGFVAPVLRIEDFMAE